MREKPEGTHTQPSAVAIPTAANDSMFQETVGAFLKLGVAISETDLRSCAMLWVSLDDPGRRACHSYALIQSAGEWNAETEEFVPRPWNYLRERQWERKAVAKGRDRPMSKAESAHGVAAGAFRRERGVS